MAEGALVVLFLLVGIACTVGLYLLVESETSNPTVVDRRTAEREAKERGGLERRGRHGGDRSRGQSGSVRDGDDDRSRTGRNETVSSSDEDRPRSGRDDR